MGSFNEIPGVFDTRVEVDRIQPEASQHVEQVRPLTIDIQALKEARGLVAAREFLKHFGGRDALLVAIDSRGKSGVRGLRGGDALVQAQALNESEFGVYYSVNRAKAGVVKKATKADIVGLRAVGFDFDYPQASDRAQAQAILDAKRAELEASPLPPSIILSSGGGIQALWILDAEQPPTPDTIATIEGIGNAVRARHGGDNVANIDRVLRVPGFINWPSAKKADRGQTKAEAVTIGGAGVLYTLEELVSAFPCPAERALWRSVGVKGLEAGLNSELAAGIGEDINFEEVRELLTWLARHPSGLLRPGNYSSGEVNWRDSVEFALANIAVIQPALEQHAVNLLDELVLLVGRNPQDNRKRFESELLATRRRLATGEPTRSIRSVFKAAIGMGWSPALANVPGGTQADTEPALSEAPPSGASSPNSGQDCKSEGFVDVFSPASTPSLPVEVFPAGVQKFIASQTQSIGADVSGIAGGVLAVAAGAINAQMRLRMGAGKRGWKVPPVLRVMLVGDPSTKKSPMMTAVTGPLVEANAAKMRAYKAALAAWDQAKAVALQGGLPRPPRPSLQPQLIINDATPEKVCEILSRSPRGSLMVRDELSGLFAKMKNERDDRTVWLESFEARTFHKQKVGAGPNDPTADNIIENFALSILGGIQPGRLRDFDLTEDGMMQRFIPVIVKRGGRADTTTDFDRELDHYESVIKTIVGLGPREVTLTPAASSVKERVLTELETMHQALGVGLSAGFQTAVGKLDGLYGRLMLVLHILNWAEQRVLEVGAGKPLSDLGDVPEATALAAEDLLKWCKVALLIFYQAGTAYSDTVQAIASYILTSNEMELTPRKLSASVRDLRRLTPREVAEVMGPLEVVGWVDPEVRKVPGPVRKWFVNPGVRSQFAARAATEKKRKKELRDIIISASKKGRTPP